MKARGCLSSTNLRLRVALRSSSVIMSVKYVPGYRRSVRSCVMLRRPPHWIVMNRPCVHAGMGVSTRQPYVVVGHGFRQRTCIHSCGANVRVQWLACEGIGAFAAGYSRISWADTQNFTCNACTGFNTLSQAHAKVSAHAIRHIHGLNTFSQALSNRQPCTRRPAMQFALRVCVRKQAKNVLSLLGLWLKHVACYAHRSPELLFQNDGKAKMHGGNLRVHIWRSFGPCLLQTNLDASYARTLMAKAPIEQLHTCTSLAREGHMQRP
jgi:hypothetical protein